MGEKGKAFALLLVGLHFIAFHVYKSGGATGENPLWGFFSTLLWFEGVILAAITAVLISWGLYALKKALSQSAPTPERLSLPPVRQFEPTSPPIIERRFLPELLPPSLPPPPPTPKTLEEIEQEAIDQILRG
jgi:hypothetical protein